LLLLLGLAVGIGSAFVILIARRARRRVVSSPMRTFRRIIHDDTPPRSYLGRPNCWVAVRSSNLKTVQNALGLHDVKPCTWAKGLLGGAKVFIAPPVKGWILIIGSGLPDPTDDPDAAFRFLLPLSRRFGQVQCFCANRVVQHHAWVRAEKGKIMRAYAWAGKTLWHQGNITPAERDLDLVCRDYDWCEETALTSNDAVTVNVEKVPALARRWSIDPGGLDDAFLEQVCGLSGEPSGRFR